jgi:4'-phosphopantetheinyl transferase
MSCWSLAGQAVHLWYGWLDPPAGRLADLVRALSADEQARAARFHFARDREHFIAARATLRMLLAGYLATEPSHLVFAYGSHGKPALGDAWRDSGLAFNLAHSNGLAVYAFARARTIGVDVEYVRPLEEMHALAETVFSPRERAVFYALPSHLQRTAFFDGWTRKEAFVKATGEGLSTPLDAFDVALAPGEPAALLGIGGCARAAAGWTLRAFEPAPGYVAAVAVAGPVSRVVCRQWRHDAAG